MNINSYYCNHFTVFSSYRYFYPSKAIINYKQFGVGVGLGVSAAFHDVIPCEKRIIYCEK